MGKLQVIAAVVVCGWLGCAGRQSSREDAVDARGEPLLESGSDGRAMLQRAIGSLHTAADGRAQNIANAGTTAYKRVNPAFAGGEQVAMKRDMSQGKIVSTNRMLDVAIEGDGFFRIKVPITEAQLKDKNFDGLVFTRAGNFVLDDNGELVLSGIGQLDPPITVPANATAITISSDGQVFCTVAGETTPEHDIIPDLPNDGDEVNTTDGVIFVARNAVYDMDAGDRWGGNLQQACLEIANVDVAAELKGMEELSGRMGVLQKGLQIAGARAT